MKTIYCHCAYAKVLPPETRDTVLRALIESGQPFEPVADLCEMAARKDPKLAEIAQASAASDGAPAVRIAACYPRAVYGLFQAANATLTVKGVQILNMRSQSADEITTALLGTAAPASTPAPVDLPAAVQQTGSWKPWFPVIDHSRCTNCMQCLSFCLFDVYGATKDGKIQVQKPANCKTDCPACSRVCPEVAIMFPKYKSGPINGEDVTAENEKRQAVRVDISALLGGDVYSLLRQRTSEARARFAKERDEKRALQERIRCLTKLKEELGIPDEMLASMPTLEQIQAKAQRIQGAAKD